MATQTLDEKGNVVVDGMNTNVTPSQFQAISTNAFTPTKPLSIPQPQPQDVSGIVGQEIANIGALQTKYDTANTQASDIYSQLAGLSTQNKEADLATAYQTGGVNDAASKIRQLNAQAQALNLESQAIPIQNRMAYLGSAGTEGQVQNVNYDQLQRNALKALSLGQQAALAQADYQTAKDKADQMITIKYADIENQINTKKLQLDALDRFVLTPTQERLKEARALALKKEERDLAEKKANEIAISDMIIEATPNAPATVVANAKKLAESGASKLAVAQALGVYGGDYLKTQLLKAQIDTEKAQKAKYYADIDKIKSEMSTKGLPSTTANLAKVEASQSAYDLANELKTLSGKGGAVGAGFGKAFGAVIPGYDGTAFSGTDRANYEAKFNQLKDTLAASNLDKLKGAMSDKDIEFLRNIGTALNLSMSETAFDAELDKVANVMARVPGVQKLPPKSVSNKFNQALGIPSESIQGTAIINSVDDNGNINFNLPK